MQEILQKISSYNIFNYLLPGTIFAFATEAFTDITVVQSDLLIGLFLYYFIGLVISRVGSLIVGEVLKYFGFIRFSDYKDYVLAASTDETLPALSEVNNTLRTMCSLFLFIPAIIAYEKLAQSYPTFAQIAPYVILILIFVLFLFSYRKQTRYIRKRVNAHKDK